MGCYNQTRNEKKKERSKERNERTSFLSNLRNERTMENEQNQNENQDEQNEIRANNANDIFELKKNQINLVNTNCSVCNSGLLDEIHALRPTHTLIELAEEIKKKYGVVLSKDALSRHFIHYSKQLQQESTKALFAKFDQEVEDVAQHQKKVLFLAKISFDHIIERLENGTLDLDVDDFEKMIKLYYSVLRNPDSATDDNIIAIFQRASQKYGCDLEQGVLIKTPKREI